MLSSYVEFENEKVASTKKAQTCSGQKKKKHHMNDKACMCLSSKNASDGSGQTSLQIEDG